MLSRFVDVVACISTSFLFIAKQYSMVQIDEILFPCSLVGYLDSFHFLAILNHVAVHVHMQFFFVWMYIYVYPEYTPRSGIAGFYGLFLN